MGGTYRLGEGQVADGLGWRLGSTGGGLWAEWLGLCARWSSSEAMGVQ